MDITVTQKKWDEQTEALIEKLNPDVGAIALRRNVENGNVSLYEVKSGNDRLGIFLTRVEKLYNGEKQLVILHAVAVQKPKTPMVSVLSPVFNMIATENDIKSIRIHSAKDSLNKVLKKNGYKYMETIFTKRLG